MLAEIQAAIASTKALADIISASKDLRNFNELAGAVFEVNAKLLGVTNVALSAQEKQTELAKRVEYLEKKLAELEQWGAYARNYELREVVPGVFVYVYFPVDGGKQPRHWVCANCHNQHKKSLLQYVHGSGYRCSGCNELIEPWSSGGLASIESTYK